MQPSPTTRPTPAGLLSGWHRATDLAALALLALFWWLAVSASRQWSQTSDELPHIAAGYVYDRFGDFRMHSENGVLPQRLFGLPPQLMTGVRFNMDPGDWGRSNYWQLGWDYFYSLDNPIDRIVGWARALNALFGVALGAFIFVVARQWYGARGGLLALGLYALCPNFLAHSALATSDLAGALFLTLAPWFFWRHLERRDLTSGLIAGLCSGLALVAKFNGLLIAPIYALLAVADAVGRSHRAPRMARLFGNVGLTTGQVAASVLIIWMFFGFRYSAQGEGVPALQTFAWSWDGMLGGLGWKAGFIHAARAAKLLPEAWLYGLTNVLAGEAARPAFFAGEYRLHGWWQFFPAMFLVKTTLALLLASSTALVLAAVRWSRNAVPARQACLLRWMPLVVTAIVVGLTALTSNLNIGHRHILAVYPVLFIAAGGMAAVRGRRVVLPLALFFLQAFESFAIRPHYLAFFNPLGGGPEKAYRLVVDSSLDWGQDLPALREWLAQNRRPGEPVYLSYFGSAWPPHYGVRPTYFLPAVNLARPPAWAAEYTAGLYCISATSLAGVYSDFKGPWQPEWTAQLHEPGTAPDRRAELRFAQLCQYLRNRTPDGFAGYSILIFRLQAAELQTVLAP